ncbi:MAG: flagellar biosynthetic protein FliR [Nitrospirae bacterium]|nr:flagellar biosynthetic protein FliR [Nitrospirota bacterium]
MKTATLMNSFNNANLQFLSGYMTNFLFIFIRSSIFVSFLPIIGGKELPGQFRIGLAFFIAILLAPAVKFEIREDSIPLIIIKEVLIALALGLTVRFVFMAINLAGQIISQTMGLSVAGIFNPEIGQDTLIGEIFGIMAMLYFLVTDAHHEIIFVFVKSFELLPAGQMNLAAVIPQVLAMGTKMFVLALKLGAPVVVGLTISNLLTGFLSKVAPQMNIFFIALPLNIFLGLLLIMLGIPVFEYVLNINFGDLKSEMMRIVLLARG